MAYYNGKVRSWHRDHGKHQRKQSKPFQDRTCGAGSELPLSTAEGVTEDEKTLVKRLKQQLKSESHKKNIIEDPRCKITSDPQFDDEILYLDVKDTFEDTIHLKIEHTGTDAVYLLSYIRPRKLKYFTLKDERNMTRKNPLSLKPGDSYETEVTCRFSSVGCHEATLVFEFKTPETTFHIVRVIVARCMTTLGKKLAPEAPYRPPSFPASAFQGVLVFRNGQRPRRLSEMQPKYENKLGKYKMPRDIKSLIKDSTSPVHRDKQILCGPLSWNTYSRKFELLLYLEEHQMKKDMKEYSNKMTNKQMAREGNLLVLEVPGVSENRPSVLCGDELVVYPVGQMGTKYRGYVHSVQLDSVKLSFHHSLLEVFNEDMTFNVELVVSRLCLRIRHRAVEYATKYQLKQVLFPSAPPSKDQPPLPELSGLFDESLKENAEQYAAVQHIVAGSSKPAPYLVFGPPGTGKTVTMAKAIARIVEAEKNCHILACAPTNSAADLLCIKILNEKNVDKSEVYRMYARSMDVKCVPTELKEFSNLVEDRYVYPAKEILMQYRIIVTTLLTASRFVSWNVPIGHFTHVFVDEAGHAVEPECVVPIAGLLNPESGQVVLAGDPEQLGPIIRSRFAQKYDLGVSLVERLKNNHLYQRVHGVFDKRYVTKLVQNYRSHSAILKVPNELFYDGELQACAKDCNSYYSWEGLPEKKTLQNFPVIFHAVKGVDEREANSPSFFNRIEVEVLMEYVKKLLQACGSSSTTVEDIGIITPYRKQVEKIRKALEILKIKDMKNLKVSSVEEFQGQERKVVLVSTVRSSPDYIAKDKHFNLGFIKDKKRFNVAMTRAKALLIVVGNPKVLRTDPNWARFIKYCKDHNRYVKEDDDDEEEEENDTPLSPQ